MKIVIYVIRFLLVVIFAWSGIEKLFLPYDASVFRAKTVGAAEGFFVFYDVLQDAGYLYFVGFFQLLCGLLLVFKRTYLLGSIMLVPLILCLLMTHVFFSKHMGYMTFDLVVFIANSLLLFTRYSDLKSIFGSKQTSLI